MQKAENDCRMTGSCVEICDPRLCCVLCYEAAMMIRCRDTQGSTRCGSLDQMDHIIAYMDMVVDVNFLVKVLLYIVGPPKL